MAQYKLNKALYDACIADKVDLHYVETLLKDGADPLGQLPKRMNGDYVYRELYSSYWLKNRRGMITLTKLFLKHGMDIHRPEVPYDHYDSPNPFYYLYYSGKDSIRIMEMLLDHGADAELAAECWTHFTFDFFNLDLCLGGEEDHSNAFIDGLRKTFLIASYPHVLSNDEDLREFIWSDHNDYDPCNFRDQSHYSYLIDTSLCLNYPKAYRSIITVVDDRTGEGVWRFCYGLRPDQLNALEQAKKHEA